MKNETIQERKVLEFDEWFSIFENSIYNELLETGAYREMDFDLELEYEKRYEIYKNNLD